MSAALTMTGRSLRLSARSPEALLTALLLPVMLMVVFVYLFGGAVSIGTAYVDYVAPGGLLLAGLLRNLASAVLVVAVAIGIGFRPHASAADFAAALGVLLFFVAAV